MLWPIQKTFLNILHLHTTRSFPKCHAGNSQVHWVVCQTCRLGPFLSVYQQSQSVVWMGQYNQFFMCMKKSRSKIVVRMCWIQYEHILKTVWQPDLLMFPPLLWCAPQIGNSRLQWLRGAKGNNISPSD